MGIEQRESQGWNPKSVLFLGAGAKITPQKIQELKLLSLHRGAGFTFQVKVIQTIQTALRYIYFLYYFTMWYISYFPPIFTFKIYNAMIQLPK